MNQSQSALLNLLTKSSPVTLMIQALVVALLFALSGVSWGATAVDDFYVLNPQDGSDTLAVIYNDRIDISSVEALDLISITNVGPLSDPDAGSVAIAFIDPIEIDGQIIGENKAFAVRFTPNPAFVGTVFFDYTVQDARGASTGTVTLQLVGSTDVVIAVDDRFKTAGDEIFIYPLENDTAPSNAQFTFSLPDRGELDDTSAVNGLLRYQPPAGDEIFDTSFTYTVTANGVSDTGTVFITVDPTLDPISGGIVDEEVADVAQVLQIACDANTITENPDETFAATCNELAGLELIERSEALENILLRQVGAQAGSLKDQAANQVKMVAGRLQSLRAGATGFSFNGLNATINGQQVALGEIFNSYVTGGAAGDGGSNLSAFITGTLEIGEGESREKEAAFDYDSQQILAGMDYRFSPETVVGLALGFDTTETDEQGSNTKLENDGITVSMYGNYYPADYFYVDWLVGYGTSSIDTTRAVNVGGISSVSSGSTDGSTTSAALGLGLTHQIDAWSMDGYLNLEYRTVVVDAYEEDNDAGLGLSIQETSTDTGTARLGARFSNAISLNFGVLIPQLEIEMVNDFKSEAARIEAELVNSSEAGTFVVTNEDPDDSYFNTGLSLTALFKNGFSGFVRYGTNLGKDDISIDTWQAGARMEFGGPVGNTRIFTARDDQNFGVGLAFGTTGTQLSVAIPVANEYANIRGIFSGFSYDRTEELDDVDYDLDFGLFTGGLTLDWHPFGGGFRMSGGFFTYNNDIDGSATPTENVEIGESTFTPEEVGTLNADLSFDSSFAPYLGIGWGNSVSPGSNWSFSADLGVLFTDNPTVELTADSPLADANPALKAELLLQLQVEEQKVNDDIEDFKYWPVVNVGFSYHF